MIKSRTLIFILTVCGLLWPRTPLFAYEDIQRINLTATMGLDSGDGKLGQSAVDMAAANDWADSPDKGGLAYGPKNTGKEY